jgi:hypothetical protein
LTIRRERWAVIGAAVLGLVLIALVIASLTANGHRTAAGCVDVTFPISIGGQELYRCGARARALCASVGRVQGPGGVAGAAVASQCRKVRLPVG